MSRSNFHREADILAYYLVGKPATSAVALMYAKALSRSQSTDLVIHEQKLLNFALRHTWSLPLLDAATALKKPHSELRHRLHVMFAILECTTEYSSLFLSKKVSPTYIVVLGFVGVKAILKAMMGVVLLKALRV